MAHFWLNLDPKRERSQASLKYQNINVKKSVREVNDLNFFHFYSVSSEAIVSCKRTVAIVKLPNQR